MENKTVIPIFVYSSCTVIKSTFVQTAASMIWKRRRIRIVVGETTMIFTIKCWDLRPVGLRFSLCNLRFRARDKTRSVLSHKSQPITVVVICKFQKTHSTDVTVSKSNDRWIWIRLTYHRTGFLGSVRKPVHNGTRWCSLKYQRFHACSTFAAIDAAKIGDMPQSSREDKHHVIPSRTELKNMPRSSNLRHVSSIGSGKCWWLY